MSPANLSPYDNVNGPIIGDINHVLPAPLNDPVVAIGVQTGIPAANGGPGNGTLLFKPQTQTTAHAAGEGPSGTQASSFQQLDGSSSGVTLKMKDTTTTQKNGMERTAVPMRPAQERRISSTVTYIRVGKITKRLWQHLDMCLTEPGYETTQSQSKVAVCASADT
ncbi:hypothetical protein DFH09DRAFT_1282950 [Mycena vulgaris]|nr:hypothetical protein DFH09DRAFT_1282950 [Mycena vulgaris]